MNIIISAIIVCHFVSFVYSAECIGKYRSVPSSRILPRNLSILDSQYFDKFPTKTSFENNGLTIVVRHKFENGVPAITMDSLHDKSYQLEFMKYNWLNKSLGSTLPAELHIVFRNERYNSYKEALQKDLGIMILSYRHQLDLMPISDMDSFYEALDNVVNPFTKTDVFEPNIMPLYHLGVKFTNYYMYVGKNINPLANCSADVIWLEFPDAILITMAQIQHFQNLLAFDGTPLMSRTIAYLSPQSPIYLAVDLVRHGKQGLVAKPFEGFGSASDFISVNLHLILIVIIGFCM